MKIHVNLLKKNNNTIPMQSNSIKTINPNKIVYRLFATKKRCARCRFQHRTGGDFGFRDTKYSFVLLLVDLGMRQEHEICHMTRSSDYPTWNKFKVPTENKNTYSSSWLGTSKYEKWDHLCWFYLHAPHTLFITSWIVICLLFIIESHLFDLT